MLISGSVFYSGVYIIKIERKVCKQTCNSPFILAYYLPAIVTKRQTSRLYGVIDLSESVAGSFVTGYRPTKDVHKRSMVVVLTKLRLHFS